MRRGVTLALAAGAGGSQACHTVQRTELTRPTAAIRERAGEPTAGRPELVLAQARLRFIAPLACPTRERITAERSIETAVRPNLATFVVGVIATAAGGVLAIRGASDGDAQSPYLLGGAAALAGGLALAIGPWVGTGTRLDAAPSTTHLRPGPPEACGDRPVAAGSATLTLRGIEVYGAVDAGGWFGPSPFALIDAFEALGAGGAAPLAVSARLAPAQGPGALIEAVLAPGAVAAAARAFLAAAPFAAQIEPLSKVPALTVDPLVVGLATTAAGTEARVGVSVRNAGPGPAFALRGHVVAPGAPALDGRVVYLGRVGRGETTASVLEIPVRPEVAAALRAAPLELSLELRDAHGTAPTAPIRFRGVLAELTAAPGARPSEAGGP
jgi:hypothetical protein